MNPGRQRIHDFLSRLLLLLCILNAAACTSFAQTNSDSGPYSQAELEQMLAPVALYPDILLAQILLAATTPVEVIEAAHWTKENPGYQGQQATQAVETDPRLQWDPSVKALVAFPEILQRMEENFGWTQRLGDAFIRQQADVIRAIQTLRRRAVEQGSLRSSEQIHVYPQGTLIAIEPASPQIIYVPYYDPNLVYGAWAWRAYPPVHWAPWTNYYVVPGGHRPRIVPSPSSSLVWSSGIAVGSTFSFGIFDWRRNRMLIQPQPGYRNPYPNRHNDDRHDHNQFGWRPPAVSAAPPPSWRYTPEHRPDRPAPQPPQYRTQPQPQSQPQPQFQFQPIQPGSTAIRPPFPDRSGHPDRSRWPTEAPHERGTDLPRPVPSPLVQPGPGARGAFPNASTFTPTPTPQIVRPAAVPPPEGRRDSINRPGYTIQQRHTPVERSERSDRGDRVDRQGRDRVGASEDRGQRGRDGR